MSESGIFREALEAITQNHRSKAREILTRLLRNNKANPDYWLWLSAVVESEKEKKYCLQSVLRLDPENEKARRGLRLLGELEAFDEIVPVAPEPRDWKVDLTVDSEAPRGFKKLWANPIARLAIFSLAGLFVVGLLWLGVFGTRSGFFAPRLTITPLAWTDTPTITPEEAATRAATAAPLTVTPQPLWMQLEATYTPRPVYASTPHPRSEAYRIAMRAYADGDYERMLDFMEQVQQSEPEAADVLYYLGEAYRLLGDESEALSFYNDAIALDAEFAPPYLGRALIKVASNPAADIEADLEQAVRFGPDFPAAHLELAAYYLAKQQPADVLAVLENAQALLADHPRFYELRARAHLALGDNEAALADALQSHELDITHLPIYLLLSEIYFAEEEFKAGQAYLNTFGLYAGDDARYWAMLGRMHYEFGEDYEAALEAFDTAVALDEENAQAYLYRGLTALELGEASQAMSDLYQARETIQNTFEISLGFGRAMWMSGSERDALTQMNAAEKLAVTDEDLAKLYYFRGQIAADLRELQRAELDFQALLALPEEIVPTEWRQVADLYLNPPTPTATVTSSRTPTLTTTPTQTLTPTLTPTSTD